MADRPSLVIWNGSAALGYIAHLSEALLMDFSVADS